MVAVQLRPFCLVTVLEAGKTSVLMVAKSLLEDADIPYLAKGEGVQDIFGLGRLIGFDPVIGPVQIQVCPVDADEARALLSGLDARRRGRPARAATRRHLTLVAPVAR